MLRFCERTPFPNSSRRGNADAEWLKNPPGQPGGFRGLGSPNKQRLDVFRRNTGKRHCLPSS